MQSWLAKKVFGHLMGRLNAGDVKVLEAMLRSWRWEGTQVFYVK